MAENIHLGSLILNEGVDAMIVDEHGHSKLYRLFPVRAKDLTIGNYQVWFLDLIAKLVFNFLRIIYM